MKASSLSKTLIKFINIKKPVFIHGAVGIGKSDTVRSVAKQLNRELRDIRLSQLDPVDLRGIPTVSAGRTVWNIPDMFPTSGEGILFFDEANSAPQSMQAAMYQLVLDRRLGDYVLPDGWDVILAGNRAIDKSITHKMGDALKNRMAHLTFDLDLQDWMHWAMDNNIHDGVLAFIRYKPSALHYHSVIGHTDKQNADKQNKTVTESMALNTPRSWKMLSDFLHDPTPLQADEEGEAINGIIGEAHGAMFQGYLRIYRKLQSPEEIILNPLKAKVDDDVGVLYATMTGLAARASEANFDAIMQYVERVPPDFQILALRDAIYRNNQLAGTPVFSKWAAKYANVLF